MPSQHAPWGPQYCVLSEQQVPPQVNLHVSMTDPVESRMTALQCTLQPFEATIDLQAEIAELREHPVSVQSVPIEEFGLSQKLRVTLQLAGVIASVVAPGDSSGVAASDGAGAVTSAEAPLFALSGSGVGSSAHAYKVSNANARPVIRTIFLIDVLQCGANRDALHGCLVLTLPKQVVARVAVRASDEQRVARFLRRTTLHLQRTACELVATSVPAGARCENNLPQTGKPRQTRPGCVPKGQTRTGRFTTVLRAPCSSREDRVMSAVA
jgi:hypothetical protein